MLPVRCFTCNKVIGRFQDSWDQYKQNNKLNKEDYIRFFETHNIQRYCCRKIFITHIDIYEHCTTFENPMIECRSNSEIPVIYRAI